MLTKPIVVYRSACYCSPLLRPLRLLLFSAAPPAPPAIVLCCSACYCSHRSACYRYPPAIVIRMLSIVIRSSHGRAVCPPLRMFSIALRSCHGCAVTALRSNLLVIVLRLSVCYCFPLSIVAALLCLLIRRQAYVWLTYSLRSTCYPLSSARYYRPAWGWTSAIQPTAA